MKRVTHLLLAGLLLVLGNRECRAAKTPAEKRLVSLLQQMQGFFIGVNEEIQSYERRFDDVAAHLREPGRPNAYPWLKELNRLKVSLTMVGNGLELQYGQLRNYRKSLLAEYPDSYGTIERAFTGYARVYSDTHNRCVRLGHEITQQKATFLRRG